MWFSLDFILFFFFNSCLCAITFLVSAYHEFPLTLLSLTPVAPPTGVREQLNGATSFLDASAVYGSSKRESDALRLFENGHLKTQADWLLPRATSHTCKDAMM